MRLSGPALGVVLMLSGSLLLTVNDVFIKLLVEDLPLGQAVALRSLTGLALLLALSPWLGGVRALVPRSAKAALWLTGLLTVGMFLFPLSLRYVPLADAVMLVYLSPAVVAALSPLILGERVGWRRWGAVGFGLAGAAFVVAPEGAALHPAYALPVLVAGVVGLRDVLTRAYIARESPLALVAALHLAVGTLGLLSLPAGWDPLEIRHGGWILAAAVLLTLAQILMTAAFAHGEAPVMSCLKLTSIPWAAGLGWIVWQDRLGAADLAGACLIAVSAAVILLRSPRPAPLATPADPPEIRPRG
ncbi:MAG: DMT family transporter [Paracoccaceae bacterium]